MEPFNIQVPDIPRLSDSNNYWYWRILLRAYLDALGLWSGNAPIECAQKVWTLSQTRSHLLIKLTHATAAICLFCNMSQTYGY
ncbi:hypothetical protein ACLKA6_003863 [Drosophila palustris]